MKAAAIAMLAAVALSSQAQRFRSEADAVRVDVLVTEGSRPVTGLTAADFILTDNSAVQAIDAVGIEDVPLSMMLVLDTSGSMEGRPIGNLKEAASAAVGALGARDRVAVLAFSEELRLIAPWTGEREQVVAAVANLRPGGSTSLADASYAGLTLRDHEPGRRALVLVFSDGADTASWLPESIVAEKARRFDGVVYGVVLGEAGGGHLMYRSGIELLTDKPRMGGRRLLLDMADTTGGEVYSEASPGRLEETFTRIVKEFRTRYLLTYTPTVRQPGWHGIEVKLKARSGRVRARRGYIR